MSRHLDEIKDLVFDEPEFEDEEMIHTPSIQSRTTNEKRPVETIVFRDPAKRKQQQKKKKNNEIVESVEKKSLQSEFDLEKARFDVHKFGMKGFEKSKYEDARVALAVSLGAKPPKRKFINYRELLEQNRAKKEKEKEAEENARLLGDLFRKTPGNKKKFDKKSKQKQIGQGDVGAMRFASVGKFQGGVLKLTNKDISKIKSKSRPRKR